MGGRPGAELSHKLPPPRGHPASRSRLLASTGCVAGSEDLASGLCCQSPGPRTGTDPSRPRGSVRPGLWHRSVPRPWGSVSARVRPEWAALSGSLAPLLGCRNPEPTLQKVRLAAPHPPPATPYPIPWGHQRAALWQGAASVLLTVLPQNLLYLTHPGACPAGLQRCPRLRVSRTLNCPDPAFQTRNAREPSGPPGSLPWALPAAGLRPG